MREKLKVNRYSLGYLTVTLVMLVFSWQFVGMAWQTLQGSFSMVTEQLNSLLAEST